MIGVVLWSDLNERKAVVWCEDQGELALLVEHDSQLKQDVFFDIGDVLQFDITCEASCRRVSNARLVREGAGLESVRQLQSAAIPGGENAKVIPFPADRSLQCTKAARELTRHEA